MVGEILLIILGFGLVLASALAVLVPILPGVQFAWMGILIFAIATNFAFITWKILLIFLALVIFTMVLDFVVPILSAKKYKASRYGAFGSVLGGIFGIFILGPIGVILGPFIGTFLGEILVGKNEKDAAKSAWGTALLSFFAGTAIKFALIISMLGYMILATV